MACITNTILFTKPLFSLDKELGDHQLKYLAIKQWVLTLIAIISTVLTLFIIVIQTNLYVIVISMDYIVSSLCIVLMYSWNAKYIDCLFYCCNRHSSKSLKDVTNLESVVMEKNDNGQTSMDNVSSAKVQDCNADRVQCEIV